MHLNNHERRYQETGRPPFALWLGADTYARRKPRGNTCSFSQKKVVGKSYRDLRRRPLTPS